MSHEELLANYTRACAEIARLRAALEQVEWVLDANYQPGCSHECAWCQASERSGHRDDCARQVALGKELPQTESEVEE